MEVFFSCSSCPNHPSFLSPFMSPPVRSQPTDTARILHSRGTYTCLVVFIALHSSAPLLSFITNFLTISSVASVEVPSPVAASADDLLHLLLCYFLIQQRLLLHLHSRPTILFPAKYLSTCSSNLALAVDFRSRCIGTFGSS